MHYSNMTDISKSRNKDCEENSSEQYRHELKYEIDRYQLEILKSKLTTILQPDPHAGSNGKYEIRSLYFDDWANSCFYDIENGTDRREKFRIRIYNGSTDVVRLECKRKECGKTLKKSCPISIRQVEDLISGERLVWDDEMDPLLKKFYVLQETKMLKPKCIVEYDRIPYVYRDGNVRITLDIDIRASADIAGFLKPTAGCRPIMPMGENLLEVKYDEFLLDHIYRSVGMNRLRQISFSKYYLCRKFGGLL